MGHKRRRRRRRTRNLLYYVVTAMIFCVVIMIIRTITSADDGQAAYIEEDPELLLTANEQQPETDQLDDDQPWIPAEGEDDSWALVLVNKDNLIGDISDNITLTHIENGYYFDARASYYLRQMMADARAEGYPVYICSAYRSYEKQVSLFDQSVKDYMNRGYTYQKAYNTTLEEIAVPGTSEHEIGLAVDFLSNNYNSLNTGFGNTEDGQWLRDNCHHYGFILRYPEDKTDITGISFEPWHFRYVGIEAATAIMEQGICLEEYLAQ